MVQLKPFISNRNQNPRPASRGPGRAHVQTRPPQISVAPAIVEIPLLGKIRVVRCARVGVMSSVRPAHDRVCSGYALGLSKLLAERNCVFAAAGLENEKIR